MLVILLVGIQEVLADTYYTVESMAMPGYKLAVTPRHVGFIKAQPRKEGYGGAGEDESKSSDEDGEEITHLHFEDNGSIKGTMALAGKNSYLCRPPENLHIVSCLTSSGKGGKFKVYKIGNDTVIGLKNEKPGMKEVLAVGDFDMQNDYYHADVVNLVDLKSFDSLKKNGAHFMKIVKYVDGKMVRSEESENKRSSKSSDLEKEYKRIQAGLERIFGRNKNTSKNSQDNNFINN